jgi:hypothetical protein
VQCGQDKWAETEEISSSAPLASTDSSSGSRPSFRAMVRLSSLGETCPVDPGGDRDPATYHVIAPGLPRHLQSAFDTPRKILRAAATTLDLDQPIAIVLPATLNLIADDEVAQRIVDDLRDGVTAGSHLVIAHTSLDIAPESTAKIVAQLNTALDEPYVTRSATAVSQLLTGFDLLEPGLVPIERWPDPDAPPTLASGHTIPVLGAIGRKH